MMEPVPFAMWDGLNAGRVAVRGERQNAVDMPVALRSVDRKGA